MDTYRSAMDGIFVSFEQKSESGDLLTNSDIGIWDNQTNIFTPYPAPANFYFTSDEQKIIRGSQDLESTDFESNLKYYRWVKNHSENIEEIQNHQSFFIDNETSFLTSSFKQSFANVTISNLLEGVGSGGSLYFQDPWYIDYADPEYGNNLRNRGTQELGPDALQFSLRSSPFSPDYSTPFQINDDQAQSYKGVFLNQESSISNWSLQIIP